MNQFVPVLMGRANCVLRALGEIRLTSDKSGPPETNSVMLLGSNFLEKYTKQELSRTMIHVQAPTKALAWKVV